MSPTRVPVLAFVLLLSTLTACTFILIPPTTQPPTIPVPTRFPSLTPALTRVQPTLITPLQRPSLTPSSSIVHSTPRFRVFIIDDLATCLVGNEYASGNVCAGSTCGDCDCTWEDHDPPAPQTGVSPRNIKAPPYDTYAYKTCLNITLTRQEVADIIDEMELIRHQVYEWSGGALDLQMDYTVLSHIYTGFTAPDFVIGPFEIDDDLLIDYVDTDTDFVYVVTGVNDYAQGLHLAYWCGSSYGEYSIHGASYAYIQYNHEACNFITIAGEEIYEALIHEWMHNLDWALYYINNVPDLYQNFGPDWNNWEHGSWPACTTGSPDPTDWFPSIDFCEWDPDWMDCNNSISAGACLHAGEVAGQISWYEHVISAHYPRDISYTGNYCIDGHQDFTETGIDSGWPCP